MTPKTVAATLALAAALSLTAGGAKAQATTLNHNPSKQNVKPLVAYVPGHGLSDRDAESACTNIGGVKTAAGGRMICMIPEGEPAPRGFARLNRRPRN